MQKRFLIAALAIALAAPSSLDARTRKPPAPTVQPTTAERPNPSLTPGEVDGNVTLSEICTKGSASDRRVGKPVTVALRNKVGGAYNVKYSADKYEIDHLIPISLGGATSFKNLWPQPRRTPWGAEAKDRLENTLHRDVCSRRVDLTEARRAISSDWIAAYRRYVLNQQ